MKLSKSSMRSGKRRNLRASGQRRAVKEVARAHDAAGNSARWTFLTNHMHVLILLNQDPSMVLRAVAVRVGITERAVQRIIVDLEDGGIIEREKIGRKNHYRIHRERKLRHPIEHHRSIGSLLSALV